MRGGSLAVEQLPRLTAHLERIRVSQAETLLQPGKLVAERRLALSQIGLRGELLLLAVQIIYQANRARRVAIVRLSHRPVG